MVKRYQGGYIGGRTYPVLPNQGGMRSTAEQISGIGTGTWPVAGYWYNQTTSQTLIPHGLVVDVNNNIYVVGADNGGQGSGGLDAIIIKYSPDGQILWSKTIGTGGTERFYCVDVDATGTFVWAGGSTSSGSDTLLAKFNCSDGSEVFQKKHTSTLGIDLIRGIKCRNDGNGGVVIAATFTRTSGRLGVGIAKTNADGTMNGNQVFNFSSTSASYRANDLAIAPALGDTIQRYFIASQSNQVTSATGAALTTVSADLATHLSHRENRYLSGITTTYCVATDSVGGVYLGCEAKATSSAAWLLKYDSPFALNTTAPTPSYSKPLGPTNSGSLYSWVNDLVVDSSDNVWAGTIHSTTEDTYFALQKLNTSGTVLSAYSLRLTGLDGYADRCLAVKDGFVYIALRTTPRVSGSFVNNLETAYGGLLVAKLPVDWSIIQGTKGIMNFSSYSNTPFGSLTSFNSTDTVATAATAKTAGMPETSAITNTTVSTTYGSTLTRV